ncbi:MAG TPA: trypsin-like peptidase domain-containing protein [Pirellulales bacterium]|jgi:S1-C subfamily serine protease|nr:trypsin-like peptidase domain-containing protein [Pirellulales bacterium]
MISFPRLRGLLPLVLLVISLPAVGHAEYRTWTAAAGGFKTEAELVELREGGTVRLRLRSGVERDIPLDKLSRADQEYARSQSHKPSGGRSERVSKLERDAAACQTAEEALRLYQVFRGDPQTTEAERQAITPKMEELSKLAADKMVRVGNRWITQAAFRQRRDKANSLMKQGLELLRLKQEDAFRTKFAEAAKVEPESIRADFMIGMLYSMLSSNYTKSKQYFDACAKREPNNVAVLNNQALAAMRRGDMVIAMASWRKAIKLEPNQCIMQNLGRLLDQAAKNKINLPKAMLDGATNMYATLLASEKFERADLKRGWMWMFIDEESMSLAKQGDKDKTVESSAPKPSEDGSVVIGGGTGFVVFPHYVLTNRHVISKGTSFDLQTSEGAKDHLLHATLVAQSEKPDLALLRCDELAATPVAIDPAPLGRGTDIMTLGYPEMFVLGASLKATRGVISAVPSSAVDDMYLYDAVINHGNSGGPVCDNRGNIVAVTTVMTNTEGKYGGGIPSAAALAFVQQHVPDFKSPEINRQPLEWPAVDQKVSPATVLVWSRSKTANSTLVANSGFYEDRDCLVCNALGVLKCGAPGCNAGQVMVSNGRTRSAAACPVCGGKSLIKCPICKGVGIDPDLQRPSEVPAPEPPPAAIADNGNPNNGPTGPGNPPGRSRSGRIGPPQQTGTSRQTNTTGSARPTPASNRAQQLDEGDFAAWSDQKLNETVAESVRVAIGSGKTVDTIEYGHGDQAYRDTNRNDGLLIGLLFAYGDFHGQPTIGAMRPVFLTKRGRENGDWHGARSPDSRHILAKPGYAVGGLKIRAGLGIDSLQVVFMRVQGDHLDPADSYESPMYGGPGGGGQSTLGGDGALIIGIFGEAPRDPKSTFNGLGLITLPVGK